MLQLKSYCIEYVFRSNAPVSLENSTVLYSLIQSCKVPGSSWIKTAAAAVTDPELCDEICSAVATGSVFTKMDKQKDFFRTLSLKITKSALFFYPHM